MKNPANRKCFFPLALAALALLVTGCPNNVYEVELTPHGRSIERKLTFYAEEGKDDAGNPDYRNFDEKEAAAIAALYPSHAAHKEGQRYTSEGEFTNELPKDVGGVGVFSNLTTSLGATGFYLERFRGNDDLAGMTEKCLTAPDRVMDLMAGWSKAELGQQAGYGKLHTFLDKDARRDLKNAAEYALAAQLAMPYNTNSQMEAAVRFGQYLAERGYFGIGEVPELYKEILTGDSPAFWLRVQRLVARKMGVPDNAPVPAALSFLSNGKSVEDSFNKYAAGTDAFRAKIKQWEEDRKKKPDLPQPQPDSVLGDAVEELSGFELWPDAADELTVRLSLPSAPTAHNGRWDETRHQVVWDGILARRDKTNAANLPFTCYAAWAQPDEAFQKAHIGKVALQGDQLVQYCLWHCTLDAKRGAEWDDFLAGLKPGGAWYRKLEAFRFAGEPQPGATNRQSKTQLASDVPRQLLQKSLDPD